MITCRICNKNYDIEFLPKKLKNICSLECFRKSGSILVESKCEQCGKIKIKPPSQIYKHTFCSTRCAGKFNAQFIPLPKKVKVKCGNCGNLFMKNPQDLKRRITYEYKLVFCTRSCKGKYDSKQGKGIHDPFYIKKGLRSHLEDYIEQKISQYFPYIKCNPNDRLILGNGTELDFYFPHLYFAIEVNGLCHYKAIYGKQQYKKTATKDKKKIKICKQKCITLMIITSTEEFTECVGDYHWNFIYKELQKLIPYCENKEELPTYKTRKHRNEVPTIYYNSFCSLDDFLTNIIYGFTNDKYRLIEQV